MKYELSGVVYHTGDLQCGHYYTRRKAPVYEVLRKGGQ